MRVIRALVLGAAVVAAAPASAHAQRGLHAVWGSGPNDIWAAGDASFALRFDGRAWQSVQFGVQLPGSINALWGSGPNDVFAAGEGGAILRWDGRAWTRMTVPTEEPIVALVGRSSAAVYALVQSYSETEPPRVLRWDGRAWTQLAPPPIGFRANALVLAGTDLLVAGYAAFDPQPSERRVAGVLARFSAGRWTVRGWDGRTVADPLLGDAGWTGLSPAGASLLLVGNRADGTPVMLRSAGAAWTRLPPVGGAEGEARVALAFVARDGTPVALLEPRGLARFSAGRWTRTGPPDPEQLTAQQAAELAQNPMAFAARMSAWDFGSARAAWGPTATDFHAVTSEGRIVRVGTDGPVIVYDAACSDPTTAPYNPVCQLLQPQGAAPQPPRPLPMPSRRTKPARP